MFQNILVPLDGSELAERALPVASELAKALGAKVCLVRVTSVRGTGVDDQALSRQLLEGELAKAEEYLEHHAFELRKAGLNVELELRQGEPHEELSAYAREQGIDLIVMTTHGYSGIRRLLIGSVTDKVIRAGQASVLVVASPSQRP